MMKSGSTRKRVAEVALISPEELAVREEKKRKGVPEAELEHVARVNRIRKEKSG